MGKKVTTSASPLSQYKAQNDIDESLSRLPYQTLSGA